MVEVLLDEWVNQIQVFVYNRSEGRYVDQGLHLLLNCEDCCCHFSEGSGGASNWVDVNTDES